MTTLSLFNNPFKSAADHGMQLLKAYTQSLEGDLLAGQLDTLKSDWAGTALLTMNGEWHIVASAHRVYYLHVTQ